MYILILALVVAIILVNLVGLSLVTTTNYLYAQKPQKKPPSNTTPGKPPKPPKPPAPTGQGGQQPPNKPQPRGKETTIGGKAPTASLVANAEKFFKKYPNRINNPPAAYAGVVAGKYIEVNGGKVIVNRNPTGQPPVKGSGSGGQGAPVTGGSSLNVPPRKGEAPIDNRYCSAGSFGGSLNGCASGKIDVAEANLLLPGIKGFPDTNAKLEVGYLALGTANPREMDKSLRYSGSTVNNSNLDNNGQAAFNYNDSSSLGKITRALEKRIDMIKAKGGKGVRFDEMDLCQDGKCKQTNFNKVLVNVAKYAVKNGLEILGNNGAYLSDPGLVTSAAALQKAGIKPAGWIVENDPDGLQGLRDVWGSDVPIYAITKSQSAAKKLAMVQDEYGNAAADSVVVHKY